MAYLPFFDENGTPCKDPAYLLFAAATAPDLPTIMMCKATLSAGADHGVAPGTKTHTSTAKTFLQVDELARERCAHVVLEIGEAWMAHGQWISIAEATRRASEGEMKHKGQTAGEEHLRDSSKKAFVHYRPIAHILAVMTFWKAEYGESETSNHALENTLARSRWFEQMLDKFFEQTSESTKAWQPLRIPDRIPIADMRWVDDRGFVHHDALKT